MFPSAGRVSVMTDERVRAAAKAEAAKAPPLPADAAALLKRTKFPMRERTCD